MTMAGPARDPMLAGPRPLNEGEVLLATFRADRGVYLRNMLSLMAVLGVLAGLVGSVRPGWLVLRVPLVAGLRPRPVPV